MWPSLRPLTQLKELQKSSNTIPSFSREEKWGSLTSPQGYPFSSRLLVSTLLLLSWAYFFIFKMWIITTLPVSVSCCVDDIKSHDFLKSHQPQGWKLNITVTITGSNLGPVALSQTLTQVLYKLSALIWSQFKHLLYQQIPSQLYPIVIIADNKTSMVTHCCATNHLKA